MTGQLNEIGGRLKALREIMDISVEKIAKDLNVTPDEYLGYEKGDKDFSFSFLYNAANILGVDVVDIISGESPKLTMCALVRNGGGYDITRREAYDYKHLAFTFAKKKAEPFMVTVQPANEKPTLHSHEGQEFNYMVEGRMRFFMGELSYDLETGDSIYFNSSVPHAMSALDNKSAKFLAIVMQEGVK